MTESNVDFPTDGKPTKPTSASTFNSNSIFLSWPGSPFSASSGAGFFGEAKRILPRPPTAAFGNRQRLSLLQQIS